MKTFGKKTAMVGLMTIMAMNLGGAYAYDRVSQACDIPKLANITVDGKADDWKDGGFLVNAFPMLGCGLRPTSDFDVRMRLGWDERGLLVLLTVKDDIGYEHVQAVNLYRADSAQFFFANKRGGDEEMAVQISTGLDPRYPELRSPLTDQRKNAELRKTPLAIDVARTLIPGGYQIEARLPWKCLGITPAVGGECAFNAYVYDRDKMHGDATVAQWYPEWSAIIDTKAMYGLRLSEKAGDPVEAAAWMGYCSDRPAETRITLAAPESFSGKEASIEGIGKALFEKRDGRALATLLVNSKTLDAKRPKDKLTIVKVDNKQVGALDQELIPRPDPSKQTVPFGSLIPRTMQKLAESTPEKRNKVKIVMFGQSIIAQEWWMDIARELHARYPNADLSVLNPSIGGVTTPWLRRLAESELYPEYPDLMVFDGYDVCTDGSLDKFVQELRSRTTTEIVLLSHHPDVADRVAENATLQQVAAKYGCEYVANSEGWNNYLRGASGPATNSQYYRADGIHLNKLGFQLETYFILEHFQYNPAFKNKWSDTITSVTPKADRKGRIELAFEGNRVDLIAAPVADGKKPGTAKIVIDGKAPSQIPELYAKIRATWKEPEMWVFPPAWRILSEKPLLIEDWTCRVTKVIPESAKNKNDGYFEFEVEGSKTGKDGAGKSNARFVSNSGRVVFETDWMLYDGIGKEFTWKVVPQFVDVYKAPEVADPSREYVTILFQGLKPGKHTLEITPAGDGETPVREIRVYRPPFNPAAP